MDCSDITVKELRKLCKKHGVRGCYKLRKKELCKTLTDAGALLPPTLAAAPPAFFDRKCKGRKAPGDAGVWSKVDLWKLCKKHSVEGCSSSMKKDEMCDVLAKFFKAPPAAQPAVAPAQKAKTPSRRFETKNCKGRKSATSWGKDELLDFCKDVGLECNQRDTKTAICRSLVDFFKQEKKRSLSLGEVPITSGKDLSEQVDHVMVFVSGLIWLIRKHRDQVCIPIRLASLRSPRFGASFCHYSICWYAKKEEMVWGFSKQEDLFWETVESWCEGTNKRFAVMPLYVIGTDDKRHMNFLVFDMKQRTVERFEPNGSITAEDAIGKINKEAKLEKELIESAKDHNYTYIPTVEFCPRVGPQALQDAQSAFTEIGDPEGFCSFWSLWYADRRLRYPNKSSKELLKGLMDVLATSGNLTRFINNFAKFLDSEKERITKKAREYQTKEKDWSASRAVSEALLWELLQG